VTYGELPMMFLPSVLVATSGGLNVADLGGTT
jgi:hypothetical protein